MSSQLQTRINRAPTAPRAMLLGSENLRDEEVRLHELLNLLHCLDKFQGQDRVEREDKKCGGNRYSSKELRRSFLDGISYLCDIEPTGGTVTAGGLRKFYPRSFQNPSRNEDIQAISYLAANEGIVDKVRDFVGRTLRELKNISADNRDQKEEKILRDTLDLGRPRMEYYRGKLQVHLKKCDADIRALFKGKYRMLRFMIYANIVMIV